jgi:hypothetical protein
MRATEVMPDVGRSCQELSPATSVINMVAGYFGQINVKNNQDETTNYHEAGYLDLSSLRLCQIQLCRCYVL